MRGLDGLGGVSHARVCESVVLHSEGVPTGDGRGWSRAKRRCDLHPFRGDCNGDRCDHHAYAYSYCNTNSYHYSYANCYPDSNAYTHGNGDYDSDRYTDTDRDADEDAYSNTNCYVHSSDSNTHVGHMHRHSSVHPVAYSDYYCNANGYGYAYTNYHGHADRHSFTLRGEWGGVRHYRK